MAAPSSSRLLLIVSDLHLSQGWDAEGKISTNEDFFFDRSFARFLKFYAAKRTKEKCPVDRVDLIIAGDMVDLLQVTIGPKKSEPFPEEITPDEEVFGLGTSPFKSGWKLRKVMLGHEKFFESLTEFLLAGNRVTILPGNHDIEFSLPEVQDCFRDGLIEKFLPEEVDRQDAEKSIKENLDFKPWFYFEPGLVYVEHGHQYDELNSFDYFLHPLGLKNFIYLPAGSFFVRYLFNKLENEFPFADNIKPVSGFVWFSIKKLRLWLQIGNYYRFFRKTLNKAGPIDSSCAAAMRRDQEKRLGEVAQETGVDKKELGKIMELWKKSALHHQSKFQLFCRFLCGESRAARQAFSQAANRIAETLKVRYVIFGHTHEAGLEPLGQTNSKKEYINTGTWTKVFAEDYAEKLLKEENEFVYTLIEVDKPKLALLRWRDDLNEGERVRLFQSRGEKDC
jgi:UDP-2,3-diacylglucosamine pyrophosphatase LpxH